MSGTGETENNGKVSPGSRLDSILKFVKILAVLASGLWVLYLYLSFQRGANLLSYKQQDLATQQAQFNLKIQQSQKEQRDQELEYSVDAKRLENEANKASLISKTTYRVSKSSTLVAHELATGLYEIILDPGIKNAAETPFEVSMIIVDYYIGKINPLLLSIPSLHNSSDGATREKPLRQVVIPPPVRGHQSVQEGAISWHRVGREVSAYSPAVDQVSRFDSNWDDDFRRGNVELDGFGTGRWKYGEEVEFAPRFVVKAEPTDYVGFSVTIIINRKAEDEDYWWFTEYESIAVALKNGSH